MTDLVARLELSKLTGELAVPEQDLAFLTRLSADDLRDLRQLVSHALHSRHESRFTRMAAVSKLVPPAISAKASGLAGPVLSARVAGVLEPAQAVRLAKAMKPEFLAEVSTHLDPARVTEIVKALPTDLVVKVGRLLIDRKEFLTLGRFTAVVDPHTAILVAEGTDGTALLHLALYTEDRPALDAIVSLIADSRLRDAVAAAAATDEFDEALSLMAVLSVENRARVLEQASTLDQGGRNGLIEGVIRNEAWPMLIPALAMASDEVLGLMTNAPATLAPGTLGAALAIAPKPLAKRIKDLLDQAHLDTL